MSEDRLVEELEGVAKRLNAVISILFESVGRTREFSLRDRIRVLDSCRLSPSEIADAVGTTDNYVNVQLSLMRKTSAKRSKSRSKNATSDK